MNAQRIESCGLTLMKRRNSLCCLDKNQAQLSSHYPDSALLGTPEQVLRTIDWITFYRRNEEIFVRHYLGLRPYPYQEMWLHEMGLKSKNVIVAARSSAKTYTVAIHACAQCILYPGLLVVVAAATKDQARIIVYEKIKNELMRDSPVLCAEIASISQGKNDTHVSFHNGSSITVVVGNENARGHRAHLLILDEYRMMEKETIDSVFLPFGISYKPPFTIDCQQYEDMYIETKSIYISSNWLRSHWIYKSILDASADFIRGGDSLFFAMDYAILLKHGIKSFDALNDIYNTMDKLTWDIEYRNLAPSESTRAFFTADSVIKCRTLQRPFYPRKNEDYLARVKNRYSIPRQTGEVRIVSCDIAMVNKRGNDNSCFSCIRLLPDNEYGEVIKGYRRQVAYLEATPGEDTLKQALRIKQLFEDFDADYCVLDLRNAGISIYDMLARIQYDPERNREYPAWKCINDENVAGRVPIMGALDVVYGITANARLNAEIAESLRKQMQASNIEFLCDFESNADVLRHVMPEYFETMDVDTQVFYERPFHETAAMVSEVVALEYERSPTTGIITVHEVGNATKDRYTSISYGNYFADLLERDLLSNWQQYQCQVFIN